MKARIPRLKPKILVCGFSDDRLSKLKDCASDFDAAVVKTDYPDVSMNDLARENIASPDTRKRLADLEECAVFCNFESKVLDRLLDELHNVELEIPLKAVLTKYNSGMTFSQLIPELKRERDQLGGGDGK